MMKDIKDYLHLYLGCECWDYEENRKGVLGSVAYNDAIDTVTIESGDNTENWRIYDLDQIKPILRPLDDILNTEAFEIYRMYFGKETALDFSKDNGSANFHPKQVRVLSEHAMRIFKGQDYETGDFMKVVSIVPYLLKHGFDLFGLIEAGLAIDGSTLIKTT